MKKTKLLSLLLAALLLCGCLTACGEKEPEVSGNPDVTDVYADKDYGFQQEMPAEGDTVAIMHTNKGDICIRFFPEAAPKAVENFTTHAKNGYYDGLTFHRVIKDFMIQGGDPDGTGAGGKSIWGDSFEDEFDKKLLNIRGSLVMANSGPNTNGSQFFINQAGPTGKTAEEIAAQYDYNTMHTQMVNYYDQYVQYYGEQFTTMYPTADSFIEANGGISPDSRLVPDEVWDLYAKVGGNVHLDGAWRQSGGHTVFGQVYEGMDIVDTIAAVETDENDKPTKNVIIKSIEITIYKK